MDTAHCCSFLKSNVNAQGWRSGWNTHLPPMRPGFKPWCWHAGLSLLLVVSLAARGFSPGTPVFPSHQKSTFPNSNSTRIQVDEEPLRGCATSKSLLLLLLLLIVNLKSFCYIIILQSYYINFIFRWHEL